MDALSSNIFFIKKYIIYEDKDIIAINKPEVLLSIPDGFQPSLLNIRDALISEFGAIRVVHRLDKLTSGVLIFAKNHYIHKFLNTQFQNREIKKRYIALVEYKLFNMTSKYLTAPTPAKFMPYINQSVMNPKN